MLIRNHYHYALETPESHSSLGMQWLQGTWAMRFNRRHGETGRPFQGRFKALLVEPGHALAQVVHYIHLNPVRARVVTAARLAEFRWSSLSWFLRRPRPDALVAETVLAEAGGLPDTRAGWRRYVEYLGVVAEEDPQERERKFGRMSRGWAIGSVEFKASFSEQLRKGPQAPERLELLGGGPEARRELRETAWEEALLAAAQRHKIDLQQLPAKKSAREKVRLAAALKATTDVANDWLAKRLEMGQPASVSQFVRRFQLERVERKRAGEPTVLRAN